MIERISELPWASFEKQLMQKCANYGYTESLSDDISPNTYWTKYLGGALADEIYCIQHQILFNAIALNEEGGALNPPQKLTDSNDRFTDRDIFFWDDLVGDPGSNNKRPHEGWENTISDREDQNRDRVFKDNKTFILKNGGVETETNLTQLPKTYAARSLIEISEYVGPNNSESAHSNYVSRKVSMLWLFNVIKAIVKTLHSFPWMRIGLETTEVKCKHPEAENQIHNENSKHGAHTFLRSIEPERLGYLRLYGDAELNGKVTTFHSQARFHDAVTMWDQLSVYGQSYFSKDINGTAMRVRWGDLAEYYEADAYYSAGTLVKFGGEKEVTVADCVANAVVTTNPGLVLNEELKLKSNGVEFPVGLALVGRVPVQVWGDCKKFDLLVADPEHPGWARVQAFPSEEPIARALQDKDEYDDLVLCATNFKV